MKVCLEFCDAEMSLIRISLAATSAIGTMSLGVYACNTLNGMTRLRNRHGDPGFPARRAEQGRHFTHYRASSSDHHGQRQDCKPSARNAVLHTNYILLKHVVSDGPRCGAYCESSPWVFTRCSHTATGRIRASKRTPQERERFPSRPCRRECGQGAPPFCSFWEVGPRCLFLNPGRLNHNIYGLSAIPRSRFSPPLPSL